MIARRHFLSQIGVLIGASPLPFAWAQKLTKVWRVGFLVQESVSQVDSDRYYGPFTQGLREAGYTIGKDVVIEWRAANGETERLPELIADLMRLKVDVLVTQGTPASLAAQRATTSLPIVMVAIGDPVGSGLIKSYLRPGGNVTGFSNMNAELGPKRLEMLRAAVPRLTRIAVLLNPANLATVATAQSIREVGRKIGISVVEIGAKSPHEISPAFDAMIQQNIGGFILAQDAFFTKHLDRIAALAVKHRLPSIGQFSPYVEAGGLMSYGQNIRESAGRAAYYVDKIIKGANPGDLPVEQPMRFEMTLNLRTAKVLGLKIPPTVLVQATRVIE